MGRWEPDARGRLMASALELYAERGFEQTTALEIAERAGVTERTFFRYFADKREVLFDGSSALQARVISTIAAAQSHQPPMEAVAAGLEAAASLLEGNHEYARHRAAVIAANPSLHERELLKLSTLGAAIADALRLRGVPEPAASLAAEAGVTIFKVGFESWIRGDASSPLAQCIREALDQLRGITAGT